MVSFIFLSSVVLVLVLVSVFEAHEDSTVSSSDIYAPFDDNDNDDNDDNDNDNDHDNNDDNDNSCPPVTESE